MENTITPEIKSAWEKVLRVQFSDVAKGIDNEGWYSDARNDAWLPIGPPDMKLYDFRNNNTEIRPVSLGKVLDQCSLKNKILDTIEDLVGYFTYYDRKDDEELSMDQINEAVASGEITVDEMVKKFREGLEGVFKAKG